MLHHEYGPSAHHRLLRCPAALQVGKHYPNLTSDAALEGTAAHALAEECLRAGITASERRGDVLTLAWDGDGSDFSEITPSAGVRIRAANGRVIVQYEISYDMRNGVDWFLEHVRSVEADNYYEELLDFSRWVTMSLSAAGGGGFGTGDVLQFSPLPGGGYSCRIVDLKFGHVFVPAEENYQLLGYAAGALQTFDWLYDIREFVLTIVQPRLGYLGVWSRTREQVLDHAENVLAPAWRRSLARKPKYNPGVTQCIYCPGLGECKAAIEWALNVAGTSLKQIAKVNDVDDLFEPEVLSNKELGLLLSKIGLLQRWESKAYSVATNRVEAGQAVPGHKLVEAQTKRSWVDEDQAAVALLQAGLTQEQVYVRKKSLIPLTEAERLVGKGHPAILLYTTKPVGKHTLVPESDRRTAVADTRSETLNAFGATPSNEIEDF